jgi:hypothetical protein
MSNKFLFLISFVLVLTLVYTSYGDTTPPNPDPMEWQGVPYARTPCSIAMKAKVATDVNDPPVEYYFECTTHPGASSSWQEDPNYVATGLTPATSYTFRVKARDSYSPPNETGWSTEKSATTPFIKIDFDDPCDPNSAAVPDAHNYTTSTEPNFTALVIPESVGRILPQPGYDVNGTIIEFDGWLGSRRRDEPNRYNYKGKDWKNEIYRDFVFSYYPESMEITLWGLGDGRKCDITIYAFDVDTVDRRIANWSTPTEANIIVTSFDSNNGAQSQWPYYPNKWGRNPERYAFTGLATADKYGRIIISAAKDPNSQNNQPFAYCNALIVSPNSTGPGYVPVEEATIPRPVDGQKDVDVNGVLTWTKGAYAVKHDIYLDTDFDDVNDANRASHANVEFYEPNLATNTYNWPKYLKMDQTYYWRIDEVNASGGPQWPGEVWSFTTRKYLVVDNLNYQDGTALREVWQEQNCAEIDSKSTPARSGSRSMEYAYKNGDYSPYYARAYADVGGPGRANYGLGMCKDWLSAGAKALSLWFYGDPGNPVNEQMYIDLTDGDGDTWTVPYDGAMADVKKAVWQEWNINLTIAPKYLNLDNMKRITIRFGELGGPPGSEGKVYFDDIRLYPRRCVHVKRSDVLAKVDYAPGGVVAGDCIVDYLEIQAMGNAWLFEDNIAETNIPKPNDVNLVVYYSMELNDPTHIKPYPFDSTKLGCLSAKGVTSSATGVIIGNDPNNPNPSHGMFHFNSVCFDGKVYDDATAITCGRNWSPFMYGSKDLTLACWVKWAGPHVPYRFKSQPIISMRRDWNENGTLFFMECDTYPNPRGSFSLRQFSQRDPEMNQEYGWTAVYSPTGILDSTIGQWVHLAAVCKPNYPDPNFLVDLYLNGGRVVTNRPFRYGGGDPCTIELTIGNHDPAGNYIKENFNGEIDEVYIFNRVLGPNEIAYLADTTPIDGVQCIPIPSGAELFSPEAKGKKRINFKDYAFLADPNMWLCKEYWP